EVKNLNTLVLEKLEQREKLAYLMILFTVLCGGAILFFSKLGWLAILIFLGCPLIVAFLAGMPTLILTFPLIGGAYTGALFLKKNRTFTLKLI
ncbi:MAG: hypothetical protein AAFU64_03690, partial [Bacteroidota bacterium]